MLEGFIYGIMGTIGVGLIYTFYTSTQAAKELIQIAKAHAGMQKFPGELYVPLAKQDGKMTLTRYPNGEETIEVQLP